MTAQTLRLVTDEFRNDPEIGDFMGDLASLLLIIQRLQRAISLIEMPQQAEVLAQFSQVAQSCANVALCYLGAMRELAGEPQSPVGRGPVAPR
ncbi:hypothetical protein [Phreatobacter cathodiphilus]|uniref:Uncharacterized protein n=1 Tax=Phreatobacter cathodiphilus TaxID=1868589 RepID=A0A2S0NDX0_9HYPH|nr:hypothetical protein [Phreatobacter cathodiphilus]AVO46236.1 hypothetical protein C6569_14850 [Phreatobacter cathodiphilus]